MQQNAEGWLDAGYRGLGLSVRRLRCEVEWIWVTKLPPTVGISTYLHIPSLFCCLLFSISPFCPLAGTETFKTIYFDYGECCPGWDCDKQPPRPQAAKCVALQRCWRHSRKSTYNSVQSLCHLWFMKFNELSQHSTTAACFCGSWLLQEHTPHADCSANRAHHNGQAAAGEFGSAVKLFVGQWLWAAAVKRRKCCTR